jgi:hypothetical protein
MIRGEAESYIWKCHSISDCRVHLPLLGRFLFDFGPPAEDEAGLGLDLTVEAVVAGLNVEKAVELELLRSLWTP